MELPWFLLGGRAEDAGVELHHGIPAGLQEIQEALQRLHTVQSLRNERLIGRLIRTEVCRKGVYRESNCNKDSKPRRQSQDVALNPKLKPFLARTSSK